jgi:Caspase domain
VADAVLLWVLLWATPLGYAQGTTSTASPAASAAAQPLLMIERGQHGAPVRRIDMSSARGIAVTASDDRTARIWDLASGQTLRVLRPRVFGAEGGRLYGVAIHPTEPLVAVGGSTGGVHEGVSHPHLIYLFDIESGALRGTIDARAGDVRRLAWSADGALLWAAYAGTHGVRAFTRDGREVLDDRMGGGVFGLSTSPTGRDAAAVGLDGSVRLYRSVGACCAAVQQVQAITLAGRQPLTVAYSPDGERLAVAFYQPRGEGVDILDARTLQSVARVAVPRPYAGEWRVLAWSSDGRRLALGGTAHDTRKRFQLALLDLATQSISAQLAVAEDSVNDLQALPGGGFGIASFDGTWAVLTPQQALRRQGSAVVSVPGDEPSDFELSPDARSLRWALKHEGGGFGFDFERRRLIESPASSPFEYLRQIFLSAAQRPRSPLVQSTGVDLSNTSRQDGRPPSVGGRVVPFGADERTRAVAVLPGAEPAVMVASNRAVYRVDRRGALVWRQPVDTEVRALNVSGDAQLVVGALADGTVRWWRASDGQWLLSLLVDSGGSWIVWSPSGYFDASAGADRLAGWAVPRDGVPVMDFHTLSRFRDTFNRPDVIDAIFATRDEKLALAQIRARQEAEQSALRSEARRQAEQARQAERESAQQAERARLAAAEWAARQAAAEQAERDTLARQAAAREAEAAFRAALAQAQREAARQQSELAAQRAREAQERQRAEREAALAAERVAAQAELERRQQEARAREAERLARQMQLEADERQRAHEARIAAEVARLAALPPAVSGVSNARLKLRERLVTLPFAVRSHEQAGVVQLSLRVAGRPVTPREVVMPRTLDGQQQGYARMELPPAEGRQALQVELLLSNRNGFSEPLVFVIEREPDPAVAADAGRGDLYVLAIGISQYERADYRLLLPAKDAADFAQAMKGQEGRAYRRVTTRVLTDAQASRSAVLLAFEWLKGSASAADTAMLFLAGHGINDSDGRFYFLPQDARHERLAGTGVSQAAIVSTLAAIRGRTVMFIDTCFAGSALGQLDRRRTERLVSDLVSNENGVVVYASSTGREESLERATWGNGAFTKALLEGLAGRADFFNLGQVTSTSLSAYLSRAVAQITEGRQRPVFISPRGVPDFTLATL